MQTENTDRDLIAELATATETKAVSAAPVSEWNFDNEEKTPVINSNPTNQLPTQTNEPTTVAPGQTNPIPLKARKLDAEASQAGIEFLTSKAAEIAISIKYGRKFTSEEKTALNGDLLHRRIEDLNPDQLQLVNRWKANERIRDKKIKKVELSDKQRERMVRAFEAYSEATGKTFLTPGSMLSISIAETLMDSLLEVFID